MYRYLLVFFCLSCFMGHSATPVAGSAGFSDSGRVEILRPAAEKERAVFNDPALSYKDREEAQAPAANGFLRWLAELLFDNPGYTNILKARKLIIWSVAILALLVVIRLLSRSTLTGLTRSTPKSSVFNFRDLEEDLSAINYRQRVAQALEKRDYRLAVRWHYLEMLYVLDKKKLIVFVPSKTNRDYRDELKSRELLDSFTALSRIYDYTWYGEFGLNEKEYHINAQAFSDLQTQLHV